MNKDNNEIFETESIENPVEETIETVEEVKEEKKTSKKSVKEKLKSVYALKYGSYATATVALFIVAIFVFNIFITAISNKYPISIDFTAGKEFSVNQENIEFIKDIEYRVDLTVLCPEEIDATGISYLSTYRGLQDATGGKYFTQSIQLLKQYNKYNKNINVTFVDPFDEKAQEVVSEFVEKDILPEYADILVECFPDGEENEKKMGIISAMDCYEKESENSGYEYLSDTTTYNITGNKIEHAIANGIYKTVNLKTVEVAMLTVNSSDDYIANFIEPASLNAFNITNVSILGEGALDKYDVAMICAPLTDYTKAEVKVLSKWLDNNGEKGKTLMYFHSAGCGEMPNLDGLLEDWGISYENGYTYYSEDNFFYSGSKTAMYLQTTADDMVREVGERYNFFADRMVPINVLYTEEPNGTRTVKTLLQTEDTSTFKKPIEASNWDPTAAGENYPAIVLSTDASETETSNVLAFASVDFITNEAAITKSDNGNFKLVFSILGNLARETGDYYTMSSKVVSDTSGMFTTSTTEAQGKFFGILFIGILPISFIVIAIIVNRRRKNL